MDNWQDLHTNNDSDYTADTDRWRNAYRTFGNRNEDRTRIVLQPAINHLATDYQPDDQYSAERIFRNASTNVARYVQTDDGVRITTAAQRATDKTSNEYLYYGWNETNDRIDYTARLTAKEWIDKNYENGDGFTSDYPAVTNPTTWRDIPEDFVVYRYDYIELDCTDGIEADQRHYDISARDDRYRGDATDYIDAVHDTEYYIVNRNSQTIDYFTDYENVKKIDKDYIEAVYAVAENTESDNNSKDYWVANVIVIEVSNWVGDIDNIALVFDNYQQTSQRVKYLDTLATKADKVPNHVVPADEEWGAKWGNINPGFFRLYDTEKDGDELMADTLTQITRGDYGKYGIHAGLVTRTAEVERRGGYIDVDMQDNDWSDTTGGTTSTLTPGKAFIPDGGITDIYAIDGDEAEGGKRVSAKVDSGDIRKGDAIIWVTEKEDPESKTIFMVIVSGKGDDGHDHDWETPSWLWDEYYEIIREQRTPDAPAEPETYTITLVDDDGNPAESAIITGTGVEQIGTSNKFTVNRVSTTITPIANLGFTVTGIAYRSGNAGLVDNQDGTYLLHSVTGDVTLTVSATGAAGQTANLTVCDLPAAGITSMTVSYVDEDGNTQTKTAPANTAADVVVSLPVGTRVTITVTPVVGYTATWEVNGTPTASTTVSVVASGTTIEAKATATQYAVKLNGDAIAGRAFNHGAKLNTVTGVTLGTPDAGKAYPDAIEVTVNGHTLIDGSQYTYDNTTGAIDFTSTTIGIESDIEIAFAWKDALYNLTIEGTSTDNGTVTVTVTHDGEETEYTASATGVIAYGDKVEIVVTKGANYNHWDLNGAVPTFGDYDDVLRKTIDSATGNVAVKIETAAHP